MALAQPMVRDEHNPFEAMMSRFDRAAELLELDPGLYSILRHPERQLIVSIPVQLDSGDLEVFTGYRVHYNTARGPAKGGIRFAPDVSLEESESLLRRATALDPESVTARIQLARTWLVMGREAEARAMFEEASALEPRSGLERLEVERLREQLADRS